MVINIICKRGMFAMAICLGLATLWACESAPSSGTDIYSSWGAYAGAKDGNRYSSLASISTGNVAQLKVAWSFSTHDKDTNNRSQIQCNPIMVDGTLYGLSPRSKLFALDAASGKAKWQFDPAVMFSATKESFYHVIRGLMYWQDSSATDRRIFYGAGAYLYAVNAADGKAIPSFGKGGRIDLRQGLDRDGLEQAFLASTTPGVIYKDLLIVGVRVSEAPGHIRAFDVRTGQRRWIFHTVPHPGERGYETWEDPDAWKSFGKVNSWAGMSLDEKRGIVYVPTASPSSEYYGGGRKGMNWFGNSLIALDAATGKYRWHYQFVHHDLWDRDLPANPNLIPLMVNGKQVDALAQITKHGYVFLFDRLSGKPLYPIQETPVPTGGLPGEQPWPTQPIPSFPEPFARQEFNPEDVSDLTPETHRYLMDRYLRIRHREKFSPPSKDGTWIFPGFDGGGEWGGAAVDLENQVLYVNCSELPWSQVMTDIPTRAKGVSGLQEAGRSVYLNHCMACHGPERKSLDPSFPSLIQVGDKYNANQIREIVDNGRNMMPSFNHLSEGDKRAVVHYLLSKAVETEASPQAAERESTPAPADTGKQAPFASTGLFRFLDKEGYPGIKPPWGTLNAVDLKSGKLLWKVPLGEYPELSKKGLAPTGTENYGGPLVTKGGLVFIAASRDEKIRAFDKRSGKILWEAKLPAAGFATPATYQVNGRQYIVIACGGGKSGTDSGDTYVAFAL